MLGLYPGLTQPTLPEGSQGTRRDMLGGQAEPNPGKGSGTPVQLSVKGIKEPHTGPGPSVSMVDRPQGPPLSAM